MEKYTQLYGYTVPITKVQKISDLGIIREIFSNLYYQDNGFP